MGLIPPAGAQDTAKVHLPSGAAQTLLADKISPILPPHLDEHKHLFANEQPARAAPSPKLCQVGR